MHRNVTDHKSRVHFDIDWKLPYPTPSTSAGSLKKRSKLGNHVRCFACDVVVEQADEEEDDEEDDHLGHMKRV